MIVYCVGKNISLPHRTEWSGMSGGLENNDSCSVTYYKTSDSAVQNAFPTTDQIQIFFTHYEAEAHRNTKIYYSECVYYAGSPIFAIRIDPSLISEEKSEEKKNIKLIPKKAILEIIFANHLADIINCEDFRGFYLDFHNRKKEKYYKAFYPPYEWNFYQQKSFAITNSAFIEKIVNLCRLYCKTGFIRNHKTNAAELIKKLKSLNLKESDSIVKKNILDLCLNEFIQIPEKQRSGDYAAMLMVVIQDFEIGYNYQEMVRRKAVKTLKELGVASVLVDLVASYIPEEKPSASLKMR